jgi:hypothetical protein
MQYRYPLPPHLVEQAAKFEEFANGAAQCQAQLSNGSVQQGLLSNAAAIIAMRGQSSLPFAVADITHLFQTEGDKSPVERGDWQFFDVWRT